MTHEEKHDAGVARFLEELAAKRTSSTPSEMQAQLRAFTKVRSALSQLEGQGIRILQGDSLLERYESAVAGEEPPPVELDFILRKVHIELQLEVKHSLDGSTVLSKRDLYRFYSVLRHSAKTEEILVVWVTNGLPTLALDLSQLQKYLSSIEGERQQIPDELLQPLLEAIVSAFERHRPVWIKPTEIEVRKAADYDIRTTFREIIRKEINSLKSTSERRQIPDKRKAIDSLKESDIQLLVQIFNESQRAQTTVDNIEGKLRQLQA